MTRPLLLSLLALAGTAEDPCKQSSPEKMAKAAGVTLPGSPWHVANTWCVTKGDTEKVKGVDCTWFKSSVRDSQGKVQDTGSLRFEGTDFTIWPKHSAFVEVYSTAKIPKSGIPKVNITFGWPRLNGVKVPLKKASAYYPDKPPQDSPDCAWTRADGDNCVVEVGPIFKRDEAKRRHEIVLKAAGSK